MKLIALSLFVGLSLSVFCQSGSRYAVQNIPLLRNTTLVVVLDNAIDGKDTPYTIALRKAIQQYWTLSTYEFKRASEIPEFLPADGFSMMMRSAYVAGKDGGFQYQKRSELSITLCNKDSVHHYGVGDELVCFRMKDADNVDEIMYKLAILVKAAQDYIHFFEKNPSNMDNYFKRMKLFQTQFRKKVKGQTLYICEDDIASGLEKAKVEQVLKQKVEILSKSQLEEAFYASKEGNCFLHVEPDQSKMWVLQMIDGKVLYVSRPVSKGKLTQKDFKDLSKKIR